MQRAAIFGGSFDPPHLGHLSVAQAAIATEGIDRLCWVPARCPPHKAANSLAPLPQRAYMLRLALADDRACRVASEPAMASGYAIDTFARIGAREPDCQWSWLLGLDAFVRLPYWYRREELVPAITWLVAPRTIATPESLEGTTTTEVPAVSWQQDIVRPFEGAIARLHLQGIAIQARLLAMPPVAISSTAIRDRRAAGLSCRHLLSPAVDRYLAMKGLYRAIPLPARKGPAIARKLL